MDKVYRRTRLAVLNVKRKAKRVEALKNRDEAINNRLQRYQLRGVITKLKKNERARRREDWELGPLAPQRNVGDGAEKYGTAPPDVLSKDAIVELRDQKWIPYMRGDRVVILKGADKGKIGEVYEVDEKTQRVTMQGLNQWELYVPEWLRKHDGVTSPTRPYPAAIPVSDVRLVVSVVDKRTQKPKDVIVEGIERRFLDDRKSRDGKEPKYWRGKEREFIRVVPSLGNLEIPKPEPAEPEEEDFDSDTLRITVEEPTWIPTLLSPPFPEGVINELRNKYSKFRTQHDYEYIAKKEQEAIEEDSKLESIKEMRTPLKELQAKIRKETKQKYSSAARKERGELVGSELLSRIGELMLQRKELAKDGKKIGGLGVGNIAKRIKDTS